MTKGKIAGLCVAFFFMFSFMLVGFAKYTDILQVTGTMEVDTPEGLFITAIESGTPSRLDVYTASFTEYSTTVTTSLSKTNNNYAGSITYTITVVNNTKYEYAYRGLYYQSDVSGYNNNLIRTSNGNNYIGVITSFPNGRVVAPGDTLEFEVTYTLGSSRSTFNASRTFNTLINYQFGINVDTEEAAREAVSDKFENILNTAITYDQLVDVLDNKFDGRQEWTSNYVGNVGSATSDDSVAVNTLFAGQLQMIIDGEVKPASVLIKHENIDGNNQTGDDYVATNSSNGGQFHGYGCEMTLYLTTDSLDEAYGTANVYVCVFTCNRDDDGNKVGDWYRVGDTYAGTANIVGYNGETGGTGSFVTDNWVSSAATYSTTSNYTSTVSANMSIDNLMRVHDTKAIEAFQELLDDAVELINDSTYAGTGITIIEEAYARAAAYYTVDASGNPVANPDTLRVWLLPVMKDLDDTIIKAREEIENITGGNK